MLLKIWIRLGMVASPLLLGSACLSPGYLITPQDAPPEAWPQEEAKYLTNIRQLTNEDMGVSRAGEAYFSPAMRHIIFQAYPTGQSEYQMYTLDLSPEGTAVPDSIHQVSPGGGACTCGFFKPDGSGIVYASSHLNPNMPNPNRYQRSGGSYTWNMPGGMDIFEADLDGSNPKRLTDSVGYDAEASYSPSGETIVFTSDRDGDPDLYIMRADGSAVRQLTNKPGYDGGPFFSPDGQRVIFRSDRWQDDHLQLFVINSDGTGERQLTRDGPIVRWAPYWHPNGKSIIYTTSIHGHHNYEVYLMNIDTGDYRRITYSPRFDGLPVFSPDGRRMMWTSQRGPTGSSHIFIADVHLPEGF